MTDTKGLKDTIACETRISAIEDDRLSYAGYDISELMDNRARFEEVIYLLWNLHLPTEIELNYFENDRHLVQTLPQKTSNLLKEIKI